jgi:2,3-dihydroxybenzoate decarboxylase
MDYLRENFYVTTSGTFRTQGLQHTLSELGTDRVLFSVDYPYESMREISEWFDNCPSAPPTNASSRPATRAGFSISDPAGNSL